jgi:hypothetical protein
LFATGQKFIEIARTGGFEGVGVKGGIHSYPMRGIYIFCERGYTQATNERPHIFCERGYGGIHRYPMRCLYSVRRGEGVS